MARVECGAMPRRCLGAGAINNSREQSAELGRDGNFGREGEAALVLQVRAGQGLARVTGTTAQVYRKRAVEQQVPVFFLTIVAINRLYRLFRLEPGGKTGVQAI